MYSRSQYLPNQPNVRPNSNDADIKIQNQPDDLSTQASHVVYVDNDLHDQNNNNDDYTIFRRQPIKQSNLSIIEQTTTSTSKPMERLETNDSTNTALESRQPINEKQTEPNLMRSFVVYEDELEEYLRLTGPHNPPILNDSISVVYGDNHTDHHDQNVIQARNLDSHHKSAKIITTDDDKGPPSQSRLKTVPYEPKNLSRREDDDIENRLDTVETTTANSRLANHLSQFIATFNPTQLIKTSDTNTATTTEFPIERESKLPSNGDDIIVVTWPQFNNTNDQSSYVLYANDDDNKNHSISDELAEMIGLKRKISDSQKMNTDHAKINETIAQCPDTDCLIIESAKTGSNYQWLQVYNQALDDRYSKLVQTRQTESLQKCQQYCWQMLAVCVGFTYDRQSMECRLAYELDVQTSLANASSSYGNNIATFMRNESTSTTTFVQPRWYRAYDNDVLIGENVRPRLAHSIVNLVDGEDGLHLERVKAIKSQNGMYGSIGVSKTFLDCLQQCMQPQRQSCAYVLHHRPTGLCLIEQQQPDANRKLNVLSDSFSIRAGWTIGVAMMDQKDNNMEPDFVIEKKPVYIRLFEQLLMGEEDRKYFLGRYLEPKRRITNVTDVRQCEHDCAVMTDLKCRFIAVYEQLLDGHNNQTKICLLFTEDLIQIMYKLMMTERATIAKRDLETTGILDRPFERLASPIIVTTVRQRRELERELDNVIDENENEPFGTLGMSAYVLDTPEPFLKFNIHDPSTISDSEQLVGPSYEEWYGVSNENQCYRHCFNSWLQSVGNNSMTKHNTEKITEPLCRFLVVKWHGQHSHRFNCSFFELSPIAFTEQSWFTVRRMPLPDFSFKLDRVMDYFIETPNMQTNGSSQINFLNELTITATDKKQCLSRCLQTHITNLSSSHMAHHYCHKLHIGKLKTGHLKCRFYERIMDNKIKTGSIQLFRLRSLPEHDVRQSGSGFYSTIPNNLLDDYFMSESLNTSDSSSTNQSTIERMLNRYEPLYRLKGETNPSNCLRLCLLLWARSRSNHHYADPDRCRVVLAKPDITLNNKYECMIYDIVIDAQLAQISQQKRYQNQLSEYPINVYRVSNNSSQNDRPQLIMQLNHTEYETMNDEQLKKSNGEWKAQYHFSHASNAVQCSKIRPKRRNSDNPESGGLLIFARPIFMSDPILPARLLVQYECLYYDHYPQQNNIEKIDALKIQTPIDYDQVLVYQLVDTDTYDYVDPSMYSQSLNFMRQSYQPILVATENMTTVEDCLSRCSEYNYYSTNQLDQCQLVIIEPNRRLWNNTEDYRCLLYNYNVTLQRYPDLDWSTPVEYYRLRSIPSFVTTRFDSDEMVDKYDSFERIVDKNNMESISRSIVDSGRLAFWHISNVTNRHQCLDRCVRTWESKLLYYSNPSFLSSKSSNFIQSHFCRLVIIIPVRQADQQLQHFDCAFYETNFTQALSAFLVPRDSGKVSEEIGSEYIQSQDDSLYMAIEWPLVSPKVTDETLMLSRPVDLAHCLRECDRKSINRCQALVTRYEQNRLIRCYFVGLNEYLPDWENRPLANHQSKLLLRLFTLNADEGKIPRKENDIRSKLQDPYLAIIDSLRNYQHQ
ncbi:hypothetical protein DERF_000342 [Dermatophagoides farinae]|uniref:Apple domain-containing protein n=1 Tax=Dermatophagoides farinae TaxID=6954 RepID=A0A922L7L2_DERFA|nr:hypothetical protein DERF_000342 [Dermatophagoides farinae]